MVSAFAVTARKQLPRVGRAAVDSRVAAHPAVVALHKAVSNDPAETSHEPATRATSSAIPSDAKRSSANCAPK